MTVTVYTKTSCPQCTATIRTLDNNDIAYNTIDLEKNEEALSFIKDELGYLNAPVVVTDTEHWSGFQPDKIAALANSATRPVDGYTIVSKRAEESAPVIIAQVTKNTLYY